MTQQEYGKAKAECWKEFLSLGGAEEEVYKKHTFDYAFKRGYALGKQQKTIAQKDIEKAAEAFATPPIGNGGMFTHQQVKGLLVKFAQLFPGKQEKDADTEEMLTVPRSKVQEQYSGITDEIEELDKNGLYYQAALLRNSTNVLDALFGSKCLPDEEPLFSNQPENYNNENLIVVSENKPTESTCTDDCPSPCPSQHFDNIINQSFADHNRLHIAAMLAAGMLASEVRCYPVDRALELADKLIAECEKGDNNA